MADAKDFMVRLTDDVARDLAAYKEALHGASRNQIVIDALRLLMQVELDQNPGFRARFESILSRKVAEGSSGPQLVKRDNASDQDAPRIQDPGGS